MSENKTLNPKTRPINSARRPSPPADTLRLLLLGGVGEFGMNALALELGGDMLLIDCGQKMPESEMLGVDMVIPDFAYVRDNVDRLRGVILTHGHEDHIGAIPYLIRQIAARNLPIFASQLTLALVHHKLSEVGLEHHAQLNQIIDGQHVTLGGFDVEFISILHSFPQSMALAIHTALGTIVHSSDYKLDPDDPLTASALERLGQGGETLLLTADSTNVDREGISTNEREVYAGLEPILTEAKSTVILSTFSSSLYRVQTVLDLARQVGRQVALCGFGLIRNFNIATKLGILPCSTDLIRPLNELLHLPPKKRLILTTGTQGEPHSGLWRLAQGNFKGYKVQSGDLVIFSSRIIPGNERAIYRIINQFYRLGAKVITERDAKVHSSGHAYRDEMARLLQVVRPRYLVPVHGELRQLINHREMATLEGLDPKNIFVIENGAQLELGPGGATVEQTDLAGQILVDGKMLESVQEVVLRDRKHLSEDGMVTAIVVIDRHSHEIIAGPDIVSRGFVVVDENEELIQECKDLVKRSYEGCDKNGHENWDAVRASIRKALRKFLSERTDRYPVILPVVVEM